MCVCFAGVCSVPITVIKPVDVDHDGTSTTLALATAAAPLNLTAGDIHRQYVLLTCVLQPSVGASLIRAFAAVPLCATCFRSLRWCCWQLGSCFVICFTFCSFVTVPRGAEWMDVIVTRVDGGAEGSTAAGRAADTARMIVVHLVQTLAHVSLKQTNNEDYFVLLPGQSSVLSMAVVEV